MKPLSIYLTNKIRKKLLPYLPISKKRKLDLDRYMRGFEDYRKLAFSDFVIVSHEKSGRTWLRVMLSRFYQLRFHLPEYKLLNFDNLHRVDPRIPAVFFTHNQNLKYCKGNSSEIKYYLTAPTILLVRDPRDVAVSYYFEWKYRMKEYNKILHGLPDHDMPLYEFLMAEEYGLPAIIEFMNQWYDRYRQMTNMILIRYEDLRQDPALGMTSILEFMGMQPDKRDIDEVVVYADFKAMKKREQAGRVQSSRLRATDPGNPNSFKARRAKVGGYRDYFDETEIKQIDELVSTNLNPDYGYRSNFHLEQATGYQTGTGR